MKKYIIKRIISLIPVLFVVSVVIFMLIHLTPGDPARTMLGDEATEADVMQLREAMGLNDSIVVQYGKWVAGLFRGDFGKSIFIDEPMTQIIGEHLGATISVTIFSLIIALLLAIPLGMIAAKNRGRAADQAITGFTMLGISIPSFLMGLFLILIFSVGLKLLPVAGYKTIKEAGLLLHLKYLIMPCISLGLMQAALITRMTRSSVLDVLYMDYIKMARAKGVRERKILLKHAFRNALLPIITVVGQSFIALLSGAMVVESVFNIPGIGQLIVNSVLRRDYEVIQAIVLVIALINVVVTLFMDLLYAIADPRVKME